MESSKANRQRKKNSVIKVLERKIDKHIQELGDSVSQVFLTPFINNLDILIKAFGIKEVPNSTRRQFIEILSKNNFDEKAFCDEICQIYREEIIENYMESLGEEL